MKKILTLVLINLLIAVVVQAQSNLHTKHFNLEKGVALKGYDPVAYFIQKKAVMGSDKITSVADGVTYFFSSAANKAIFQKDATKYEPQYGGWCAYAMGNSGEKVEVDPETFKIVNGKLYLFYHSWVNNTLNKWNLEENKLKTNAEKNWTLIYR
jgi:YHS domain-containing protein